jgi:hypothetical protein
LTYYFKFCRNSRFSRAWYFFLFCPSFCPHKQESPIFKGWLIQKNVQLSVFLGVGVNCDSSLSFRRTLPRLRIVIFTIFWEQVERFWAWICFHPIFRNNVEFNCIK